MSFLPKAELPTASYAADVAPSAPERRPSTVGTMVFGQSSPAYPKRAEEEPTSATRAPISSPQYMVRGPRLERDCGGRCLFLARIHRSVSVQQSEFRLFPSLEE
eukprot:scaffold544_cov256-Pinguiococcus_pyrenoidosus.AAC.7